MKNKISSFNSYRKKVVRKTGLDSISPSTRHGETLIPAGSETATVELPATKETFTYEIVNSDSMSGDIKVVATAGSLKGLLLNNTNGSLSIMKIPAGSKQIEFGSEMKDGSYANTISDGNNWFFWGVGVGNGLATSTITYDRNSPGGNGESSGGDLNSAEQVQQFAPILITDLTTTADYPSGPAENDLQFSGTAEPGSTLNIYNELDTLIDTVSVGSDGRWSWTIEDLSNGEHTFKFKSFVDGSQVAETLSWTDTVNGASVSFECPEIQIEVGTSTPNFPTFPTITNPLGDSITPTVNSTTYLNTMAEGDTFTVTFDYSYETNSYQQTVNGVVVNLVQPSVPEIATVGGNTSGVAISTTIVDIEGTASPNARVDVWKDGTPNTLIATVTADGNGDWIISSHDFGFNTNSTCIVRAQQQTYRGSLWSESSQDFIVVYEQNVLDAPTIAVDGLSSNSHTNQANPFNISGTGVVGAEITLNGATPLSPPVIVDSNGDWSTTINLSGDAAHTLTAQASKAGFTTSQQSLSFRVNVDRTAPYFTDAIEATTSYLGQNLDTLPSAADAFSAATVAAAYVPSLSNAEGTYVATYTATDLAGNTATDTRTITVTTATIIPTNLVVVDNGDGTFTVTGDVDGEYADNLTVQLLIDGLDDGVPVVVSGNQFIATTRELGVGDYLVTAISINSEGEESDPSEALSIAAIVPDETSPVITITNDEDDSDITNGQVTLSAGGTFTYTVTATDNVDGDISNEVIAGGDTLDLNTAATYNLSFSATDSSNNSSTATLQVVVVEPSPVFLEETQTAIDNLINNAEITNGIFSKVTDINGATFTDLEADGGITYDETTSLMNEREFTISLWIKFTQNIGTNNSFFGGAYGPGGTGVIRSDFRLKAAGGNKLGVRTGNGSTGEVDRLASVPGGSINVDEWYHLAFTYQNDGAGGYRLKIYVNGENGYDQSGLSSSLYILPKARTHRGFGIGKYINAFNNGSSPSYGGPTHLNSIDSLQIKANTILTDPQIAAIANQSDRQLTIEDASSL